jgi:prophage regulatory protein
LLRLPAVIERTGLSRSSIYRAEAAGTFPRHVKLGAQASAWLASDIDRWIAERVAAARAAA